jgi:broad specificity phosphatase PhoE
MKEDDAFDAELTELGKIQAESAGQKHLERLSRVQLVVSSPLSRAIQTADLVLCPLFSSSSFSTSSSSSSFLGVDDKRPKRVCVELFREINGWLLNAKRRTRTDLQERFHSEWDFTGLSLEDESWTEDLESEKSCAERYYQGILWLLKDREEEVILTVAHGGLLRFGMVDHPNVMVMDGRSSVEKRFGNCELREYEVDWWVPSLTAVDNCSSVETFVKVVEHGGGTMEEEVRRKIMQVKEKHLCPDAVTQDRPLIILREIHHD